MNDCTRCLNFEGSLFKDTPYAKDTCKITGGIIKEPIENCSGFIDRGIKPWSPYIREVYETIGGATYKTIKRVTDGETIRLKSVRDDWIEVDKNNMPVTCIDTACGISRQEALQIRANILEWVKNGFNKRIKKDKSHIKDVRTIEFDI